MDNLEEKFIAAALVGLMSHAIVRENDESADKVAKAAVLVGRKTAAAFRAAELEDVTAPEPQKDKAKKKG